MTRMTWRKAVVAVALAAVSISAAWANNPPVVSNVIAGQRTDGSKIVDIYYNLSDPDGDNCTVTVQASDDGGSTWGVPITAVGGAVGTGIPPGTGKHILWDSAVDLPGAVGSQYKVRVCAYDGQGPGGDMVLIPAGSFDMGDTFNEGGSEERPVHSVYIDAFYIGTCEVTNQQYCDGLNWAYAQGGLISISGGVVYKYNSGTSYPYCDTNSADSDSCIVWNGSTFTVEAGRETQPMVEVSWYGAVAYCNWRSVREGRTPCYDTSTWNCNFGADGYRLPTEAEWEKAARGGTPWHRFPWSDTDTIQHARANYYSSSNYFYDTSPTRGCHPTFNTGVYPYTSPVGYFAPNGYGVYDAAGNVWEWCHDWYSSDYYGSSPTSNPTGPGSGSGRVLRGGGWGLNASNCRVANRSGYTPDNRRSLLGFRCSAGTP